MSDVVKPPAPLVKEPARISSGGVTKLKEGRGGYSIGEIKALGLNVEQARLLGIYVDIRRRSVYEANVARLREWLVEILRGEASPPLPAVPKRNLIKPKRRRAFRGLTTAGRRARGLMATRYKEIHNRKYKKKAKERALKRRHEAGFTTKKLPFFKII
ncbi:MAG: ribosomal protein L13e [Thermoproteus sp.]|nr:ribosomal protein L13e [Thermoproteus sp.]